MARTLKSLVLEVVNDNSSWISPGELYQKAKQLGYDDSQEMLIETADRLSVNEIIQRRRRGMAQNYWYSQGGLA